MIQSMTGFGSAEQDGCRVEIRSVNHRFLEVNVKSPNFLNRFEMEFRACLKEYFQRGKIDAYVSVSDQASTEIKLDTDMVKKVCVSLKGLQEELSLKGEIDVNGLIGLRDMFISTERKFDPEALMQVFRLAAEDLLVMRRKEGDTLASELTALVSSLSAMNAKVKALAVRMPADARDRFRERLATLLEGREVDDEAVLQEAAVFASRLDITEETTRFDSHLGQFGEIMAEGGSVGRKLDFLIQELNREANTIASKSTDYEISKTAVDMKTCIEKLREQIQNIQ